MDAKESLKSAIDRFQAMASGLNRFVSLSEKVVLGTGSKLQHLEDDATDAAGSRRAWASTRRITTEQRHGCYTR
jgi:hypothetical protein